MRDPFKIEVGQNTCVSFSGGRTSAYMLWRVLQSNDGLPADAKTLFCNTGLEAEETLRFVRDCGLKWAVPITWLEYRCTDGVVGFEVVDFESASRNGEPFEQVIQQRGGILPNQVSRYCSSELKTRTMSRYLRSCGWTDWDTMIGIRGDEPRRVAKFRANPHPESKAEEVFLPLADAGIDKHAVSTFWRSQSFDLELLNDSGITPAGNCSLCYLKPVSRVVSLIAEKPERATWWIKQEAKAESSEHITGTGARFAMDRPSYAAMALSVKQQRDFIGHGDEEAIACYCGD